MNNEAVLEFVDSLIALLEDDMEEEALQMLRDWRIQVEDSIQEEIDDGIHS